MSSKPLNLIYRNRMYWHESTTGNVSKAWELDNSKFEGSPLLFNTELCAFRNMFEFQTSINFPSIHRLYRNSRVRMHEVYIPRITELRCPSETTKLTHIRFGAWQPFDTVMGRYRPLEDTLRALVKMGVTKVSFEVLYDAHSVITADYNIEELIDVNSVDVYLSINFYNEIFSIRK